MKVTFQRMFVLAVAAAAACSLADFEVGQTFTASVDPYVRISAASDAGTVVTVVVNPGPTLVGPVDVSLINALGVDCKSITLVPADAATWTGALTLSASTDASALPTLLDASVHFASQTGFTVDLPLTVRVGSNLAIVTPTTCDFGGPTLAGPTCMFTVPPDAPNLVVWAIAGGGGGGAGTDNSKCVTTAAHGGNGGNGGWIATQITANPGSTLLIIAGTGGSPGHQINNGVNLATGGGGGGLSGVFDGVDAAALIVVGGGGGGGGGACVANAPVHGARGGEGSGDLGDNGSGPDGGGGGALDAGGVTGATCDLSVFLVNGSFLKGGGCIDGGGNVSYAVGGAPGGGNGYGVGQSISGGGGGGAGWFGGGGGGGECGGPASGGGGGSGWVSPLALAGDAGAPLRGTVDAGPGSGGNGATQAPAGGLAGFVYVTLP